MSYPRHCSRAKRDAFDVRMFTVVPVARSRLNVSPAGTVNELMFTVVHLTASSTSSNDEIVPVQSVADGAASATRAKTRRAARRTKADILCVGWVLCGGGAEEHDVPPTGAHAF